MVHWLVPCLNIIYIILEVISAVVVVFSFNISPFNIKHKKNYENKKITFVFTETSHTVLEY